MSYKRWIFIAISIFGIGLVLGLVTPSGIDSLISEEVAALVKDAMERAGEYHIAAVPVVVDVTVAEAWTK